MSENAVFIFEKRGADFWITINRPDKRNALNKEVIAGIRTGYAQAHAKVEWLVQCIAGSTQ